MCACAYMRIKRIMRIKEVDYMPMFSGENCAKKFAVFIALLIVPFAAILALSAFLGFIASILTLGLLSIALRIIVDIYGDRMLTHAEVYMNTNQMEEFGKKLLDPSNFKKSIN